MSTLRWTVKSSFAEYVLANGGEIETEGAQRADHEVVFEGATGDRTFTGTVRYTAHGGMLAVAVSDPQIVGYDDDLGLTVRRDDDTRVRIASLNRIEGEHAHYAAILTREGAKLFDDHYPTGTVLDPIRVDTAARVPQVAIVGSGPAGCYTAQALQRLRPDARMVVFERMPVPYGLVRFGIAADHQGTKAVTRQFDRLFERDGIVFVGNADVGREIPFDELRRSFDATVVATGLPHDRPLGVPGEDLTGLWGSGAFTAHLNGHPRAAHLDYQLGTDVVVIGAGNVAVDIVRILAKQEHDLAGSDIHPHHAESTLAGHVQRITLLSRSPLANAKCDPAMIKELGRLRGVRFHIADVHIVGLDQTPNSAVAQSIMDLAEIGGGEAPRLEVTLRFGSTPVEITGTRSVESVRTREVTGEVTLPATSVISAIGFQDDGDALPTDGEDVFPVGWVHFGPRGALPEARQDAKRAADAIAAFLDRTAAEPSKSGLAGVLHHMASPTDFEGWRRIDRAEVAAAAPDRARKKLLSLDDLLVAARSNH